MNPFQYGGVVQGDQFCDRTREVRELRRDIANGLNVLVYAPRRFGKTSLVRTVVAEQPLLVVFFDLMRVVDKQEFVQAYFHAISNSLERSADRVMRVLKDALRFRPQVSVTFDQAGNPLFSLTIAPGEEQQVTDEVLTLPLQIAERRRKRILIVFDEFQEIVRLGIEGALRSTIQSHGSDVSYLFMGSKKSIMERLFLEKDAPFFKSVKHIPLSPIAPTEWQPFLAHRFSREGKSVSRAAIDAILAITGGFPYYTQQIAYELFELVEDAANEDAVARAVDEVIAKEEDFFLLEWDSLAAMQKKALRLVANVGPFSIYSKAALARFTMTASTLKKAVDGLIAKDVIDRTGEGWYFQDPLFAHYVRTRL